MWTVVAAVLLLVAVVVEGQSINTTVLTANGWMNGTTDGKGHKIWYGVPYAQAPVGDLRWHLPKPPLSWTGVRSYTKFGLHCPQPTFNSTTMSEDCLFLNINSPDSWIPGQPLLPVMIWIHGGSFWGGSGDVGANFLQSDDMVFVSINYRLGAMGFSQLPQLVNATADKNAGFYGIQDQRMAFQWVKQNIAAFGGNPNLVTISGQSAGAISVCIHIAAPRSKGLFQRALMESGSCNQLYTVDTASYLTRLGANATGCGGASILTCLYTKSASDIVAAFTNTIWPSFNEYEQIMEQPISLIRQGKYNKVGLLAGTNHDEQAFQTCMYYPNLTADKYNGTLSGLFRGYYLNVARMYPLEYYSPPVNGITAAWTDSRFRYPTIDLVSAMSDFQNNLFLYSFNHIPSNEQNPGCYQVQHSAELNFLFSGGAVPAGSGWWTPGERVMANSMREWWSSFVATGTPYSNTSKTTWTPYVDSQKNYMDINCTQNFTTSSMSGNFLMPYYTFWLDPVNYTGEVPNPRMPTVSPATTTTKSATSSPATSSAATTKSSTLAGAASSATSSAATSSKTTTIQCILFLFIYLNYFFSFIFL